ncbi:MAG: Peptidyl-tRNA hydrolase [Candidatus Jorgensenbacteria bacterium GW2011_GWA1_48_13]|uniref:Peptidyl-tRNA hydrolase n=2 Tax=Candidatus Joergenseniibacteriota TaxID=1752739 RepID=A0A0G1W883_9BACT|nr:MAG: Peptidyl-tRNA hydrolase [Candidatus Jorgensenbacteria bacterium GW2011_GWA1_48_13]KKU99244.1 MAG: Peptidyl-tRNA hydrolase [Candidatus Jorgensenbacteria bacterium GW2011_GWC1_48_8]KKW14815.1 MAG: Peptidyl-tRNA hydrolase [Candidatus Jorgensenbacteria bacterium GW2011_GWB1_50_10]
MQPEFNPREIQFGIGLGNPGKEYGNTYHNVGHLFIDYMNGKNPELKYKFKKSTVFMNESGRFVFEEFLKFTNLKAQNLLVVHDDSDLALGRFKLSFGSGSAGHKGVQSVIDALKTKNFWRLRIGVRSPQEKNRQKAEDFVLKTIKSSDKKILLEVFEKIRNQLA